jgi:hypothetical protein
MPQRGSIQYPQARPICATLSGLMIEGGCIINMQTSRSEFFKNRAALCKQLASSSEIPEIQRRMLTLADDYLIKAMSAYGEPRPDLPNQASKD